MIPVHLIETFVVFGECQNLVKTAKQLGQTQPSASRQIEQFQKFFKKPLFKVVGRQKQLTDYGSKVQSYYKKSILELRDLQQNIDRMSFQNQVERLTLAARSEILQKYISPLPFQNPIEIKALSGAQIRESLETSQLDMAVLQENFETYNYFRKKLFSDEWRLIIPKTWNPISTTAQAWLAEVNDAPFASYDKTLNVISLSAFKNFKLPPLNVHFVVEDWRLITDKVTQQACWAIVPSEYAAQYTSKDKVIGLSLKDLMKESNFYLYFRKDLARNKDVQNLIRQLS